MRPPQRLSSRAFWGLASWALPLGVVFVVSPKLLHLLGAERFGVLMIALVTPIIACQLEFGITSAALRRFAARLTEGRIDAGETLFTLFVALTIIGLALGIAIWASADLLSAGLGFTATLGAMQGPQLVKACAVWTALSLGTLVPGIVARAAQALVLLSFLQTTATVALWVGALMLLQRNASLVSVVGLGIALTIVTSGATMLALRRLVDWRGPVRFARHQLLQDARFSAGVFAAQAAGALVNQGDRMLVSALGSPAMAGLYALCVNVANKTVAAVVAITSFVFPHAAALKSAGHHDATIGLVHALDRAIAALIVPILVPGLLLAETFLRLWLGDFATAELAAAFRILLVAFADPLARGSNQQRTSSGRRIADVSSLLVVDSCCRSWNDVFRCTAVRPHWCRLRDVVRICNLANFRSSGAPPPGDTARGRPASILVWAGPRLC